MRTIIELPDDQVESLDALCEREGISRAEAIRRAVAAHLRSNRVAPEAAYGVWKNRPKDGLAYQRKLRREWDA